MPTALSDSPTTAQPRRRQFRFRLVHLIYAVSLLGVSLGTFGLRGLAPIVFLALYWAIALCRCSRPRKIVAASIVTLLGIAVFLPATSACYPAVLRMRCSNNLKRIAQALYSYHQKYSCFPPAYVPDQHGRPQHSWRVLILPFLGHQSLYNAYNFDEPWDSPSNRKLLNQRPVEFVCPGHAEQSSCNDTCTSYLAVVGPGTAWPGPTGKRLTEFVDPTGTVLLVDAAADNIAWMEPRDLSFPDALELLSSVDPEQPGGHRSDGFFEVQFLGRYVATVDGSVDFIAASATRRTWSERLLDNDGAKPMPDSFTHRTTLPRKLQVGNCVRLGVWIVLVLLPLPWAWLNRNAASRQSRVG